MKLKKVKVYHRKQCHYNFQRLQVVEGEIQQLRRSYTDLTNELLGLRKLKDRYLLATNAEAQSKEKLVEALATIGQAIARVASPATF